MKRFFTLCAATIAMLLCSVTVSAKTLGTGGYGSLVWIMSDDGELIVTGNGEMLSANTESEYPGMNIATKSKASSSAVA